MARTGSNDETSSFPRTRLSILERLRSGEPEVRRAAFGSLASGYWRPIYKYLRLRWHVSEDEAEDLTQGFLAEAFEKGYLERFEPAKARFRTFLRVCLDRYVMNQKRAEGRVKRGGRFEIVRFDFEDAEGELRGRPLPDPTDMEALFRRELIRDLFGRTVTQVREELRSEGKDTHYRLFERYDLDPVARVTYVDLAAEQGIEVTQVTNRLARVRRLFRQRVLENLREISGTDDEYRSEARELFGLEVE